VAAKVSEEEDPMRWDGFQARPVAKKSEERELSQEESGKAMGLPISGFAVTPLTHDEIREMARILIVSLTGFLTAGWFLSRALSIWLFMFCGMMFAVIRMGAERGLTPKKDSFFFQAGWSACITCALVVAVSLIIRFRNF
jgi:hypothetical protein